MLGFDVGDTENEAFWTDFLRSLKTRGLDGVQLVISDAHTGLKKVIDTTPQGASWQRCRVHFMRNMLAIVPKGNSEMVASIPPRTPSRACPQRTIFAQPDITHVRAQFDEVTRVLERSHPKVAGMLNDAKEDLLAFTGFPAKHWRQTWSTNPLERANKEIKRPTDVVGAFPNPAALLRLAGAVLVAWLSSTTDGKPVTDATSPMAELETMNNPDKEVEAMPEITAA